MWLRMCVPAYYYGVLYIHSFYLSAIIYVIGLQKDNILFNHNVSDNHYYVKYYVVDLQRVNCLGDTNGEIIGVFVILSCFLWSFGCVGSCFVSWGLRILDILFF
jgi:hypothetical protein